ncbi:uncharacterized protein LOC110023597 [Phalaenopsis equestris]|uniref:uncharacterized protein LOC110023597 n=1 Tax=Phalaenopsis equestris TaxID=78828 RepID=UPI0009E658A1|nr:uncharacterized protein LOC110023597 [Phalaenopsis equestris]
MAEPAMAIGLLAVILFLTLLFLLLHLFFHLLRRRTHPPYELETPPISPAKLSPFHVNGVLRAPKSFLLSSPVLDAMLQPPAPSANATECFVCISNPVFDSASGRSEAVMEENGDRSPELKLMKKLPLSNSVSATETNRASFLSEELCSSPSW